MKKKRMCYARGMLIYFERKNGLKMRITLLFLLAGFLNLIASESFSQQKKLSVSLKNATVEQVLGSIEDNSDYNFVYNRDFIDLQRKVNVDFSETEIDEILNGLFNETNVTFQLIDRTIVLSTLTTNTSVVKSGTVSGKVTDSSGQPLPGVTVVVKGTTNGTITGMDGDYMLTKVPSDATLVFSFVGMKTQEISVLGKTTINAKMLEDAIGIEEVVAIGYGSVKKSDLTGSVGSVQGDLLANRQTTQLSQALQGTLPGVMVSRTNGSPGGEASIRIRGITTIGDSDPLVIIDGVPGNINDVNPNDVENISVLKDGASAAIYGSRAAAGVILVTTKRAKTDQLSVDYSMEYGIEKPTILPEFVDVARYMEMTNELRWNDNGNSDSEYPIYSKDLIDNYYSLNAENPDLYPNTDWVGLILNKNAPRQSHVLSINAGSKSIRTKASLAYDETDGLYDGRIYERWTARLNNDVTISKNLSTSVDFYAKRAISKTMNGQPIGGMWGMPALYAAVWSNGQIAEGKIGVNPYASYKYGGFSNSWSNQLGGKLSLDFTPLDGLKLSAIVSPSFNFNKSKSFYRQLPYYDMDDPTLITGYIEGLSSTKLNEARSDSYNITSQLLLNYNKTIGSHSVATMLGYEDYYSFYESISSSTDQMELTSYPYLDLGNANYLSSGGNAIENAYRSYFGRLMYNYKSKYFLQGNIRYDASSRFYEDYRWGAFPSFSGGWVITEEPFMGNLPALSFLKLRGSWGRLGNERIGNYPYQSRIEFGNSLIYKGNNLISVQNAAQRRFAIKDISWETTETINIGIDVNSFDNRLQLSGDWYKKVTKDMLLELEIPDYIGFLNPQQNTGRMNTKGWEFELRWHDHFGELNYSVSTNISDFKSIMGDLGGKEFLGDQVKFEGSEFNEWYGYVSEGIYQTQEEVNNSAKLNSSVKPGDVKYKDISGPDGVPDGKISSEYDRVLLGGSLPRYLYGGNIQLNYKNFDFSMVFQGIGKQNAKLGSIMVTPLGGGYQNIPKNIDGNYWSNYNTDKQNLQATYPRLSAISNGNNYTMSDFWLINGAYFRLKNITLGYNIPESLTQKVNIKSLRVYSSVSDFFTIDNYLKGWDPEVSTSGYPITASFIFGLTVKF